ncbi:hypothetical protein N7474_008609 [Penicillium riverlandense]|uniref:uncharacterized protein n=1 Tax=Penicillium riverlandense TaxID=1903569 RepID=UPI002547C955|nr:uncharacterized protein N7474_008609 [Penicillium riverlandense]KAJ5812308.1 hypothetical protein N7474_008609 [Penicillium riverlandense]
MASDFGSIVFTPPLGGTVFMSAGSSSLILTAASTRSVELFVQIGDDISPLKRIEDVLALGELQVYQVSLNATSCGAREVSVFEHGNGGRQHLGTISLVRSTVSKAPERDFCTKVHLDEREDFKSQRLEWLDQDQWEGWAWYRPRDTWIEASFTSLRELSPQVTTHSLLLRPTTPANDPQSVFAVFPASSSEAFATLSAARADEPPGIYARVRRVKKGGNVDVFVTGKIGHKPNPVTIIREAIDLARDKYGLSTAPFQTDTDGKNPFNRLGFCTWSSIGENVPLTYDLMKNLVRSLRQDKVPIGTFIIDDGWQDIRTGGNGADTSRGLWTFGTWPGMGCNLSEVVELVKDTLPTVQDVGVWMTLYGYWNSVAPDSPLAKKYEMRTFRLNPNNLPGIPQPLGGFDTHQTCSIADPKYRVYCLPPKHRAYDFWKDYFSSCATAGVSFVKVDNQAYGSFLEDVEGGEEFVAIWDGMTKAANEVFGENRVIHCMAHYERMFNGDVGLGAATNGKKIVFRNSDDFGLPRPNVHRDHIRHNIYNALLTSNLCIVPDADMFMTNAQWPEYHATLRAFFDGPVLAADKPGSYDPHILEKLIGLSPASGTHEVIKTENAIRPLRRNVWERFLDTGVGPALKGSSYIPSCHSANIVLWNCRAEAQDDAVDIIYSEDILDALDLPAGSKNIDMAFWASDAAKASLLTVDASTSENKLQPVLAIRLPPKAVEILSIAPFHAVGEGAIACLGLIDKYAGLVVIANLEALGTQLSVKIRYQGTLGFLISESGNVEKDLRVSLDGKEFPFTTARQSEELYLVLVNLNTGRCSLGRDYYTVEIGFS